MEQTTTPIGRASWVFIHKEGDEKEKGPAKYKLTLMLPKNREAIKHLGLPKAKEEAWLEKVEDFVKIVRKDSKKMCQGKWEKKWDQARFDPVLDGDDKVSSFEGNANFWLLRAKTKFKPKLLAPKKADGQLEDGDTDPSTGFCAGCWCRIALSSYLYDVDGNKGVGLALGFVQKAYKDEEFSAGGITPEDDIDLEDVDESDAGLFDDDDDDDIDLD